jgi:hypothetical protein
LKKKRKKKKRPAKQFLQLLQLLKKQRLFFEKIICKGTEYLRSIILKVKKRKSAKVRTLTAFLFEKIRLLQYFLKSKKNSASVFTFAVLSFQILLRCR